jgi:peroxiredoxin
MSGKLKRGERFPPINTKNIHGVPVTVPDAQGRWTHLQFRRFAGCPVCNLHLQDFIHRNDELERAGIHEVVAFHSSNAELLPYQGRFPFDVIGDPEKVLYHRYGVEASLRAILDPRGWKAAIVSNRAKDNPTAGKDKKHGIFGLPADFLISPEGILTDVHYGVYGYDQWAFDKVLQKQRLARLAA